MTNGSIPYTKGDVRKIRVVDDFLPTPDKITVLSKGEVYDLPQFLNKRVSIEQYRRWLHRKATAHCRRDRKRHPGREITIAAYKRQMHEAVKASEGIDWYTGEDLDWEQISTYDNESSKAGRSIYKAKFARLPTVDHVPQAGGYQFVICGWRTNDAKNDLSLDEFLNLCRRVIKRHCTSK